MKVLVVVPYFDEPHRWMISGQKTAFELSKKHQVVVFTTGQKDVIEKRSPNLKIYRFKDIFIKDPVNYSIVLGLGIKIRSVVRAEKPEVALINKHMFFTSFAIWPLKRLGLPVVVQTDTFPGINWFPKSKLVGIVMWIYARLIGNSILRAADSVVLLHEELTPFANQLGLKSQVIHNGVDLPKIDATPEPADLRKKPGEVWIGYVGRLESVKGWYDLAAVALKLVSSHKNWQFFFVGPKDNAKEQLAQLQHPQLHFLGLRKDVAGIDKMLDVFVMPSLSEGLSNAIMEAMTAGAACLVTNVGGNKILVTDDETGLLFEPRNQEQLEAQIVKMAEDPKLRQRLSGAARQNIETHFSLEASVGKLAKLLAKLASYRPKTGA